jgi:sporulation protein YlmC with PRC-barrel domain
MPLLSPKDEGKWLTDERGRELGVVTDVDPDRQVAQVEAAPNLTEAVIQGFGFGDADADDFEVPADWIVTVTDSELRARSES